MHDSARPFSRLQSTHKPSPSGEGISLLRRVDQVAGAADATHKARSIDRVG